VQGEGNGDMLNGYDIGGSLRGGGKVGVFLISPFSKRLFLG